MKRLVTSSVFLALVLAAGQSYAAFSSLFVVGDSLSDTGNAAKFLPPASTPWDLIPSAPYSPSNVFSNGSVWVETFASNLGLSAVASQLGGTNGALGGARTDSLFGGIDQANGWANFLGTVPDGSLWVVWIGGNDVRDAAMTEDSAEASQIVNNAVANVSTIVTTLANAGAQNFLIPNLSDLGLVPEASLSGDYLQNASELTTQFNSGLSAQIANLENALPAIDITTLDVFKATNDVFSDPTEFGFSNVTDPCLEVGGDGVCANPDSYFFWDGIHPTAALHAQTAALATAAVTLVPIPAALPLLLSALIGMRLFTRQT
jgi:phospholipase/lecithinase/hemolysin